MASPPRYPSLEEVTSLYKRLISEASTPLYDAIVKGKEPVGSAAWQYDGEGAARFYANAKILDAHCPGASKIIFTKGIPSGAVNSLSGTPFQYRSAQHLNNFKEVEKDCTAKDAAFKQLTAAYDFNSLLTYLRSLPGGEAIWENGRTSYTKLKLPDSINSYESILALVKEADYAIELDRSRKYMEQVRFNRFFEPPKKAPVVNLLAAAPDPDPHGLKELFGAPSGGAGGAGAPRGGFRKTRVRKNLRRSSKMRKTQSKSKSRRH